jgi:thymidylate kinase
MNSNIIFVEGVDGSGKSSLTIALKREIEFRFNKRAQILNRVVVS